MFILPYSAIEMITGKEKNGDWQNYFPFRENYKRKASQVRNTADTACGEFLVTSFVFLCIISITI